jgi:hypothetical protein
MKIDKYNQGISEDSLGIPCLEGEHNRIVMMDGKQKREKNCNGWYFKMNKVSMKKTKIVCLCRCHKHHYQDN